MRNTFISVSLMCMDFLHVQQQIEIFNRNLDGLHFDIMDGHFCKNLALSPAFLRAVRSVTDLPIDVHIMAQQPGDFIEEVAKAGATSISLHAETVNSDAFRSFQQIQSLGCKVGLVLNPATTLESVIYMLGRVDILTIMTVDVGFAGQAFITEMLEKIRLARKLREEHHFHYIIQIDGGCRQEYYKPLYDAGADAFIVGNAGLFSLSPDLQEACTMMRRHVLAGINGG